MAHKVLDPQKIIQTVSLLHKRICERFPESGLADICLTLEGISVNAAEKAIWIARPILWLRALVILGCILFLGTAAVITYLAFQPFFDKGVLNDILLNVETEINFMILIGGATVFIWTLENRYKRWRALQALHELRSVAHVIDMHQLTKDPDRVLNLDQQTTSSPEFTMTSYELRRYLDYCSEMLSLVGKVAVLYVQDFDDSVALAEASEIENLSTGLSRKIWQKLLILHTIENRPRNESQDSD